MKVYKEDNKKHEEKQWMLTKGKIERTLHVKKLMKKKTYVK